MTEKYVNNAVIGVCMCAGVLFERLVYHTRSVTIRVCI